MSEILKQQVRLAYAFDRGAEGLADFVSALQNGADPDYKDPEVTKAFKRHSVVSELFQRSLERSVKNIVEKKEDGIEDELLDVRRVELCFAHGADIRHSMQEGRISTKIIAMYNTPMVVAILAEMAYRDIAEKNSFAFDFDGVFEGVGHPFPNPEKDTKRVGVAERMRDNQHAFVEYVRHSNSIAANFLRNIPTDHPSAHTWTLPMGTPDHTQHPRPHPNALEKKRDDAITFETLMEATEALLARDPNGVALMAALEVDEKIIKEKYAGLPMSWNPSIPS